MNISLYAAHQEAQSQNSARSTENGNRQIRIRRGAGAARQWNVDDQTGVEQVAEVQEWYGLAGAQHERPEVA